MICRSSKRLWRNEAIERWLAGLEVPILAEYGA